MTKTEHILLLGDKTSTEIAKIVGCSTSYVRAVWQRQRSDVQAADRARAAVVFRSADRQAASAAAKEAYRNAKKNGASTREAAVEASKARSKVANMTYDHARAAAAWRNARAANS